MTAAEAPTGKETPTKSITHVRNLAYTEAPFSLLNQPATMLNRGNQSVLARLAQAASRAQNRCGVHHPQGVNDWISRSALGNARTAHVRYGILSTAQMHIRLYAPFTHRVAPSLLIRVIIAVQHKNIAQSRNVSRAVTPAPPSGLGGKSLCRTDSMPSCAVECSDVSTQITETTASYKRRGTTGIGRACGRQNRRGAEGGRVDRLTIRSYRNRHKHHQSN